MRAKIPSLRERSAYLLQFWYKTGSYHVDGNEGMEFAVRGMRAKEECRSTFLTQVAERQVYTVE